MPVQLTEEKGKITGFILDPSPPYKKFNKMNFTLDPEESELPNCIGMFRISTGSSATAVTREDLIELRHVLDVLLSGCDE